MRVVRMRPVEAVGTAVASEGPALAGAFLSEAPTAPAAGDHVQQLMRLGERLDTVTDDAHVVPGIVVEAVLALPAAAAVVWMVDDARSRLTARDCGHVRPEAGVRLRDLLARGALDLPLGPADLDIPLAGPLTLAARQDRASHLSVEADDPLGPPPGLGPVLRAVLDEDVLGCLAVVPISGRAGAVGVLAVFRSQDEPAFEEAELDLLRAVGRRAGGRIEAARRFSEMREKAAIVESVTDAILAVDAAGTVTTWNGGCADLFGVPASDVVGRSLSQAVPHLEFEGIDYPSVMAGIVNEGHWRGRLGQHSLSRRRVEVEADASARTSPEGDYAGFVMVLRDLSATGPGGSRRSSPEPRFSEELLDALDSPAAVLDADGVVVAANARWRARDGQRDLCMCGPVPPGTNWLASLCAPAGPSAAQQSTFASEVVAVLGGRRPVARLECRCAEAGGDRDMAVEVVRLHGPDGAALVVQSDVSWRRRLEDELSHRAMHDDLTGLPNRAALMARLEASVRRLDGNRMLAVLFCDLDGFKDINDGLGHAVGDQVLVAVARRLRQRCRSADVVARFGGDEFVVVLPVPDVARAVAMADRLVEVLGEPIVVGDAEVAPGASIGITVVDRCPEGEDPVGTLLRDADTAMYHAKERGRGRFEIYDTSLRTNIAERLELASALRRATMDSEFDLVYQSRRTCGSRQVNGVEALLRWRHPTLGQVPPTEFVPIAERTGRIVQVGGWALRRALGQVAELEDRRLSVAVNVSPRQLAAPRFVDLVDRALASTGLEPWRLTLEITEGALVDDPMAARAVLADLRRLGTVIALDDFGTGWSSMAYLRTLPVDVLKIDRSFVADLPTDPDACAVVSAVLGLGHGMGLLVVAEGVERLDQLDVLRDMGCDEYQGFIDGLPGVLQRAVDTEALLG